MRLLALVEPIRDAHAPGDGVAVFAGFGVICLLTVAWACHFTTRRQDRSSAVLAIVCLGAMVAVLNEPVFDLLGKIYYAENTEPVIFTSFERPIPAYLLAGYTPFVGVLPFLLACLIREGTVTRSQLRVLAAGSFLAVVCIESIGTGFEFWAYYGEPPLKYIGVAPQMAAVPLVAAFLMVLLEPRLEGTQRLALVFVGPISLAAVYAGAGWPMYFALHTDLPKVLDWLAGATSMGLVATIVYAVSAMAVPSRTPSEAPAPMTRRPDAVIASSRRPVIR